MAIKIIKSGKEKTFLTSCSGCGTDFTYNLSDVIIKDDEFVSRTIKCPECNLELYAALQTQEEFNGRAVNAYYQNPYPCCELRIN